MYLEFLEALAAYIRALNETSDSIDESSGLTPCVDHVPVLLGGELCGFLHDEIGGAYSYREATKADIDWWNPRPWGNS